MGEDPAAPGNIEYASVALEELSRVEKSISHLLRFAREEDVRLEPVALPDVIDSALAAVADRARAQGVAIEPALAPTGELRADREQLRRVVLNLLANALDAVRDEPAPRVEVQCGESLAGDEVWLRVRDNGPGIPADLRGRIWSPFFSSKAQGTGLGLALSRKIVEAHGGEIEALGLADRGTELVVRFPRQRPAERAERRTA